ncbi:chemotaxis protein CheD [Rhodovulum imhoffii]|uniref:Probable chemoreceptor glutamine deamidase CheD n=1 Tax=Rhodovulum imhoffii TaxID=365340 RepID=A0A2T5BRG4_9RHOB|nr:chemotaxis protein CheD [Rhodovulum imhoffii]MBK5933994.1 chemotaxis protein CheD [Rhodovulum imhoffii]PTN01879.1 chemotaxis protein CheD [Rhodovulum imhoffii]
MIGNGAKFRIVNVLQGEFYVTRRPDEVLSTVLGSCVAVCMMDPMAGIGGMNHFLLPERDGPDGETVKFGAYAMELLINALLKGGARRSRLAAKVFGGSSLNDNLRDIGRDNADFARGFLTNEKIPILSESLGGTSARRIRFSPATGLVQQFLVPSMPDLEVPGPGCRPAPLRREVELFN